MNLKLNSTMKNIETVWKFVETYFPDYSSSDKIARNIDLRETQETEDVQNELNDSNAYIYEKAIEGYLESLKSEQETDKFAVYWSVEDFEAMAKSMFQDLKDIEFKGVFGMGNWEQFYDKTKFPEQLERMINAHDANDGITWLTVEEYVTKCEFKNEKNE